MTLTEFARCGNSVNVTAIPFLEAFSRIYSPKSHRGMAQGSPMIRVIKCGLCP